MPRFFDVSVIVRLIVLGLLAMVLVMLAPHHLLFHLIVVEVVEFFISHYVIFHVGILGQHDTNLIDRHG